MGVLSEATRKARILSDSLDGVAARLRRLPGAGGATPQAPQAPAGGAAATPLITGELRSIRLNLQGLRTAFEQPDPFTAGGNDPLV